MPQELAKITLDTTKGQPTVEIIFGDAHVGSYRFFLWDAAGKNPAAIAHGNNIDDVVDTFTLTDLPPALDQRIISYELIIQAAEARDGQLYSVTITVRQQGEVCTGGFIQGTGTVNDIKTIIGFRRVAL